MGSDTEPEEQESENGTTGAGEDAPAWADGLKELYRSVVDEPLPGSFKDLLDQFDETGDDGEPSDPDNAA